MKKFGGSFGGELKRRKVWQRSQFAELTRVMLYMTLVRSSHALLGMTGMVLLMQKWGEY